MNREGRGRLTALIGLLVGISAMGTLGCAGSPGSYVPPGCFTNGGPQADLVVMSVVGPSVNNAYYTFTTDGTCGGGNSGNATLVRGQTQAEADNVCSQLGLGSASYPLNPIYPSVAPSVWQC